MLYFSSMADDISDVSSLPSDVSENISLNDEAPIQLHDQQPAPRQTFLRRLSTGISSIQSESSGASSFSSTGSVDVYPLVDPHPDIETHDYFGVAQIHKSATRPQSRSDLEDFPVAYDPNLGDADAGEGMGAPLTRRKSTVVETINKVRQKLGFWDDDFKADRLKVVITFLSNYVYLILGFVIVLSIYWGSYYGRAAKYRALKFLVVLADSPQQSEPIMANLVSSFFTQVPILHQLGHFTILQNLDITALANVRNLTIQEEVNRQVHERKYWAVFYVKEYATETYLLALKGARPALDPSESLMDVVYSTGSNFNTVNNYITTMLYQMVNVFYGYVPLTQFLLMMIESLTEDEKTDVINTSPTLLTSIPTFKFVDLHPVNNQIFTGILTIGLIYMVVFTFFQFVFLLSIHSYIAARITGWKYIVTRMLVSQIAYFILSLSFVTLNTAFQIPFNVTFGNLGFLVIWMLSYLTMSSLGSFIEMLALIMFKVKPQLVGFIMLFVAVTNVSPVVSGIELSPTFYRYGYAMPIYNTYQLMHVCYFNAWKGQVGLNIGVLIAWIVVTNVCLLFVMYDMGRKMKKAAAAAVEEVPPPPPPTEPSPSNLEAPNADSVPKEEELDEKPNLEVDDEKSLVNNELKKVQTRHLNETLGL